MNATIDALLAANASANIIVASDFNEFQFEEPMRVLTGELDYAGGTVIEGSAVVLENLSFLLAPEERYSTLFEGNAPQIDHNLASVGLAYGAVIEIVHTNTPLASVVADHDPVLARFNIGTQTIAPAKRVQHRPLTPRASLPIWPALPESFEQGMPYAGALPRTEVPASA